MMKSSLNRPIRLALPSRGELEEPTLSFLSSCDLDVNRRNPRQYTARLYSLPDIEIVFQRVIDIVNKVADGTEDFGITGYDVVSEAVVEKNELVVLYPKLGFGQCSLVLAVPDEWLDVDALSDLADIATTLREKGQELRVATKYPNLTRDFLHRKGVIYFQTVSAEGALESAPRVGYADVIADIMSTGTTLRENHLKTIRDGTIVQSEACLIGNRRNLKNNPEVLTVARTLLETFEAYLRARPFYSIISDVLAESPDEILKQIMADPDLSGTKGPTISKVYTVSNNMARFNVQLVVESKFVERAVEHIRNIGGTHVLVTKISYMFEAQSHYYEALLQRLKRPEQVYEDQ